VANSARDATLVETVENLRECLGMPRSGVDPTTDLWNTACGELLRGLNQQELEKLSTVFRQGRDIGVAHEASKAGHATRSETKA